MVPCHIFVAIDLVLVDSYRIVDYMYMYIPFSPLALKYTIKNTLTYLVLLPSFVF